MTRTTTRADAKNSDAAILKAVAAMTEVVVRGPSIDDLAEHLGCNKRGLQKRLKRLRERKMLHDATPHEIQMNGLRVTEDGMHAAFNPPPKKGRA